MYNKQIIGAVIVSFNSSKDIIKGIISVKNQVNEVVIIDNGSNDETIKVLRELEFKYKVKVFFNNVNKGIAYALNIGLKYFISKGYKWVITLDQDSICTKNMIRDMIDIYFLLPNEEQKKVAILVPKHLKMLSKEQQCKYCVSTNNRNLNYNGNIKEITGEITSGNVVKLEILKKTGFFEEKLFIDYVDFEFCLRVRSYNYKIILIKDSKLLHLLGEPKLLKIFNKKFIYSSHSHVRKYYIARNRLYVWKKYFKREPLWVCFDFLRSLRDIVKIVFLEDNSIIKLKYFIKGIRDCNNNIFGAMS